MQQTYDVVVFGLSNPDIVVYPPEGIKLTPRRITFVNRYMIRLGGPGSITAAALARLGLRTSFVGNIGKGVLGELIKRMLKEMNVDTRNAIEYPDELFTIVLVDEKGEGGTMIATLPMSPLFPSSSSIITHFKTISKAKILFIAHWFWPYLRLFEIEDIPKCEVIRELKKMGYIIALDINYKAKDEPEEHDVYELACSLKYIDILLPNEFDAKIVGRRLFRTSSIESIVQGFLRLGPRIIGLKMGERGCYVVSQKSKCVIPAFVVKNIVDTAGAGDVFNAAFIYGWLKGWDIVSIGRFANAVAAYYITHPDPKKKFPTYYDVVKFLKYKQFNL